MKVYSPIYTDIICNKVEDVLIQDLNYLYNNGYGLGEDLVEHLTDTKISLFKCPKSGFLFYTPSNVEGDANYYKQLEARNTNYYNSNSWEFYQAKNVIKKEDKVLEIGSGNLSFLRLVNDRVEKLVGLELNDASVKEGLLEGFEMYNETVQEFSKNHNEEFDVICSFQVLEHISKDHLDSFISHSIKCLKKGGRLLFAVPNNSSIFFRENELLKFYSNNSNFKLHCTTLALNMPPHHMGLWNEKSLRSLVNKYPIKIRSLYKEELANFRIGLVRDILTSKAAILLGLNFSRKIINKFFTDRIIKKYFSGDSILIEFEKK